MRRDPDGRAIRRYALAATLILGTLIVLLGLRARREAAPPDRTPQVAAMSPAEVAQDRAFVAAVARSFKHDNDPSGVRPTAAPRRNNRATQSPSTTGATSPEAAVSAFLKPFAHAGQTGGGGRATPRVLRLWHSVGEQVDPAAREALRFYRSAKTDPITDCGAGAVLLAMYTGDTGEIDQPAAITGSPLSAATHGDESIVTAAVRYTPRPQTTTEPPPAHATIKVLVIKRGARWWVATPAAFNPVPASHGGLTTRAQRAQHAKLVAGLRP